MHVNGMYILYTIKYMFDEAEHSFLSLMYLLSRGGISALVECLKHRFMPDSICKMLLSRVIRVSYFGCSTAGISRPAREKVWPTIPVNRSALLNTVNLPKRLIPVSILIALPVRQIPTRKNSGAPGNSRCKDNLLNICRRKP